MSFCLLLSACISLVISSTSHNPLNQISLYPFIPLSLGKILVYRKCLQSGPLKIHPTLNRIPFHYKATHKKPTFLLIGTIQIGQFNSYAHLPWWRGGGRGCVWNPEHLEKTHADRERSASSLHTWPFLASILFSHQCYNKMVWNKTVTLPICPYWILPVF